MRRILLFLLVVTSSLLISSCLTIEEHITLNADGSGTQVNTVDMSSVLENPLVKMGMAEEMKKAGGTDIPERVDSSFRIIDELLPVNPQWTAKEQELVGRVSGKILMDLVESEGIIETTFRFNNPGEIQQLAQILADANQAEGKDSNPFSSMSGQNFLLSTIALKGTKLSRTTIKAPGFENPLAEAGLDEDTFDMMMEMFGDAVVAYRIDFPGKIKKVSGFPGHELEGENSIFQAFDFMELMENPEAMATALTGEVKFKK